MNDNDLRTPQPSCVGVCQVNTSIFVPFTRLWACDDFLKMFNKIDLDCLETEVIFFNDTHDLVLQDKLQKYVRIHKRLFGDMRLEMSGMTKLGESGDLNHANKRRGRIIQMRYRAQELISDTQYLFCLEDDTFVPPTAFRRLRSLLDAESSTTLVSGVECGRWAYKHIGAWHIDPLDNPQKISSLPYQLHGTSYADGTGMFCYMTYTDLYKRAQFRNEAEPLGPDVCYGLDLRRKGYTIVVDWETPCEHKSIFGNRLAKDASEVVTYHKQGDAWSAELARI